MSGLLSRDQILEADDSKTVDVEVPEWGGTVRVKAMSGQQRDRYEIYVTENRKSDRIQVRAQLVALCAVDDAGKRVFTDKDVTRLGHKSAAALDRVWAAARNLSGLTTEDEEAAAEGFGDDQNGASTSA